MKLSRQNIIIGLSCLLVLQIVILMFLYVFNFQNAKIRAIEKPLIAGLNDKNITGFEIKDYMDSFSVKKDGSGVWFVYVGENTMPVNASKVQNYIKDLAEMKQGVAVANTPDSSLDSKYGFDEKNYQELTILCGSKKYSMLIGNTGSKRGTSYIKYNGEKKIREVKSAVATETSNQPINWARREILGNIPENDVKNYAVESTLSWFNGSYSFSAKENTVKDNTSDAPDTFRLDAPLADPNKKLSDYVMQRLMKEVLTMKASEYKFGATLAGRTKSASMRITLKNEKVINLSVYNADEDDIGDYIIDSDADNYLYLIHEEDLKKAVKEL
ncbi:MAG: DUF4340 domain-containing protein [Spirochaetales bacterium]|nr:DUF4340 domain-containing protein [Spirochaetales bacterium]